VLKVALGWDDCEVPLLCLACWKIKNAVLYAKYATAHKTVSTVSSGNKGGGADELTSATQKLARIYSEIEHFVFFVVMVNVPDEEPQNELTQAFLEVLPNNLDHDTLTAINSDSLRKYRPKRNQSDSWWCKLSGISCAPWLVPLNKLSETMEALVAIEVDPVLLLLCVTVVCHCVRTALIKCPLELGGTVYVTVCTCTACILVPDGP
jgi:hypothetical protein